MARSIKRPGVFIDTSAFYALADRDDRNHAAARAIFATLHGEPLHTSDLVTGETWQLIDRRLGRSAANGWLHGLREGVHVDCCEPSDLDTIERIAEEWRDQTFSFADMASFAIIERLGLQRAFTYDRHFTVYRFGPRRGLRLDALG